MFSPLVEKVFTIALIGYVIWMIIAGRSVFWSSYDNPNIFLINTHWVFRDEETGLYWVSVALHIVLVSGMAYFAFFQ